MSREEALRRLRQSERRSRQALVLVATLLGSLFVGLMIWGNTWWVAAGAIPLTAIATWIARLAAVSRSKAEQFFEAGEITWCYQFRRIQEGTDVVTSVELALGRSDGERRFFPWSVDGKDLRDPGTDALLPPSGPPAAPPAPSRAGSCAPRRG